MSGAVLSERLADIFREPWICSGVSNLGTMKSRQPWVLDLGFRVGEGTVQLMTLPSHIQFANNGFWKQTPAPSLAEDVNDDPNMFPLYPA